MHNYSAVTLTAGLLDIRRFIAIIITLCRGCERLLQTLGPQQVFHTTRVEQLIENHP
jgi:hypothetical protein